MLHELCENLFKETACFQYCAITCVLYVVNTSIYNWLWVHRVVHHRDRFVMQIWQPFKTGAETCLSDNKSQIWKVSYSNITAVRCSGLLYWLISYCRFCKKSEFCCPFLFSSYRYTPTSHRGMEERPPYGSLPRLNEQLSHHSSLHRLDSQSRHSSTRDLSHPPPTNITHGSSMNRVVEEDGGSA